MTENCYGIDIRHLNKLAYNGTNNSLPADIRTGSFIIIFITFDSKKLYFILFIYRQNFPFPST
jgi:hypothetical protein